MKTVKVVYWIATGLIALMMAFSAFAYFTKPEVKQGFAHLGFPDYFRVELGIAKLIGVVVLILPVSARVKEWAYGGFTITFISAFIAHTASGDPMSVRMNPIIAIVILAVSYVMFHRLHNAKNGKSGSHAPIRKTKEHATGVSAAH